MIFRNLAIETDSLFWKAAGVVERRDQYTVVRDPARPEYFWGNLLIFADPPEPADAEIWPRFFAEEFADVPEVRHVALTWDDSEGRLGAAECFEGFKPDQNNVLVASQVRRPQHFAEGIDVRVLEGEEDWKLLHRAKLEVCPPQYPLSMYAPHVEEQLEFYRRLVGEGRGAWYGAFVGTRLAGNLGLFSQGEYARFQFVDTAPEFRRQGICRTLLYEVCQRALATGTRSLVLVPCSNETFQATKVYESVGFERFQRVASLEKAPPDTDAE